MDYLFDMLSRMLEVDERLNKILDAEVAWLENDRQEYIDSLLNVISIKIRNGTLDIIRPVEIFKYEGPTYALHYELNSKGKLQIKQKVDYMDEPDIIVPYNPELSKQLNKGLDDITPRLIKGLEKFLKIEK